MVIVQMTKEIISVTIERELIAILNSMESSGKFRNKSHIVEHLINKGLEKEKEDDKDVKSH